ncbi:MAG: precorrin-3B C(17)-methyltransferase [Synechococcus sp.]|nr:precorrin-3B C(17)-methyltransferase [Synechococcus sp.]
MKRLGLCASKPGLQLLEPLLQAGELDAIAVPAALLDPHRPELLHHRDGSQKLLAQHWQELELIVGALAAGALVRLIAPQLEHKQSDPAVLLLADHGQRLVPLLGNHQGGGERFAAKLAPLLHAEVVHSGFSATQQRIPLDSFGKGWGWRRGSGDWDQLMHQAARELPLTLAQQAGQAEAGAVLLQNHTLLREAGAEAADLSIGSRSGPGCRWHPPLLWLGVGCERNSSLELLRQAVDSSLAAAGLAPEAVAGLASHRLKGDEAALLALAAERQWPLKLFAAEELAQQTVPNPSTVVAAEVGCPSVAEAASLLAAGEAAALLQAKTIYKRQGQGAVTLAISEATRPWAPQRGQLQLIGAGPGALDQLTGSARSALAAAQVWVGYSLYLDLLEPLRRCDQVRLEGQLTRERERCQQALELARQGINVALISSGESGMYGMAGLALEQWLTLPEQEQPSFAVHPGISAFQMAAARLGAPLMHDLCTISLSDRLTPWSVIEQRLKGAAAGDFVVALYNPRSRDRHWQLGRAVELLLEHRPASTPVAICRQLSRSDEQLQIHNLSSLPLEQVDMFSLVLIGNSTTRLQQGRLVTPRGYPGAELS